MPSIEDLLKKTKKEFEEDPEKKLQKKLTEIDLAEKEKIAQVEAIDLGFPYINLKGFPIDAEAISLIPKKQALELKTLCFFYLEKEIRLAAINPLDSQVIALAEKISEEKNAHVEIYKISERSFESGLKLYGVLPEIKEIKKVSASLKRT